MTIEARVILDSYGPYPHHRATTLELRFWRSMLSELLMYRMFVERNSESGRSVPIKRRIRRAEEDCYYPVVWGTEQPGMSVGPPNHSLDASNNAIWEAARNDMVFHVKRLTDNGVHKGIASRLLEPFMHHRMIFTGSYFGFIFEQRIHPAADENIRELATKMKEAIDASTPVYLKYGEWHAPFQGHLLADDAFLEERLLASAGEVARVSYDSDRSFSEEDQRDLGDRMSKETPIHASPFGHVLTPHASWRTGKHRGPMPGWTQLRHTYDRHEYRPDPSGYLPEGKILSKLG